MSNDKKVLGIDFVDVTTYSKKDKVRKYSRLEADFCGFTIVVSNRKEDGKIRVTIDGVKLTWSFPDEGFEDACTKAVGIFKRHLERALGSLPK